MFYNAYGTPQNNESGTCPKTEHYTSLEKSEGGLHQSPWRHIGEERDLHNQPFICLMRCGNQHSLL